jgi:hypothetical protein
MFLTSVLFLLIVDVSILIFFLNIFMLSLLGDKPGGIYNAQVVKFVHDAQH